MEEACPPKVCPLVGQQSSLTAQERPPGLVWSVRAHVPLITCALCFVVGGLKSPWRGEYKEPRHPPPRPTHSYQTLSVQPSELSPGALGPQPADDTAGGAPKLQPPLPPDPPERNKYPSLNWGKEESGTWEPLPLSSLDPAPTRNPSSPERKATFPEQELQQLEIGTSAAASGSLGSGPGPTTAWASSSFQPVWVPFQPLPQRSAPAACAERTLTPQLDPSQSFTAVFPFSPQNYFSTAYPSHFLWRSRSKFSRASVSTASPCQMTVKR